MSQDYIKSTLRIDSKAVASELESRLMKAVAECANVPFSDCGNICVDEGDLSNIIMDEVTKFMDELDCEVLR